MLLFSDLSEGPRWSTFVVSTIVGRRRVLRRVNACADSLTIRAASMSVRHEGGQKSNSQTASTDQKARVGARERRRSAKRPSISNILQISVEWGVKRSDRPSRFHEKFRGEEGECRASVIRVVS